MIYLLRQKAGPNSASSSGTFVKASGEAIRFRTAISRSKSWRGGKAPAAEPPILPAGGFGSLPELELSIVPALPDQELITEKSTRVTYWEGSVMVSGRSGQNPVSGSVT